MVYPPLYPMHQQPGAAGLLQVSSLPLNLFFFFFFLFQSPPKGPTIPFKPAQFSVPPPASPTSVDAATAAAYASPPPPAVGQLPPLEPLPLMQHHHMYQPLMAANQFPVGPCLRYTTVPLPHPTAVFSLVGGGGGGGQEMGKSAAAIYCPTPLEASPNRCCCCHNVNVAISCC